MTAPIVQTEVSQIAAPSPRPAIVGGRAVSGGVRWAPLGTLPSLTAGGDAIASWDEWNARADLGDAFVALGRVSDTGVKRMEDRSSSKVYDWGGNTIAILQTQFGIQLDFDLLQVMNADVQAAAHGDKNVDVTPADATQGEEIFSKINSDLLDTGVWVIDSQYQGMWGRLVLPYARPTKIAGPDWSHKTIASFKLTIESMPDNDNNHAYEFWNGGKKADGTPV